MSLRLHWFIPSHSDGRDLAAPAPGAPHAARRQRRQPDIDYLAQVARAADQMGFDSALTPMGMFCEDPWMVAAALARETKRLTFMIALRPGLMSPTLAAQMASTGQRLSDGRISLNIVTGGDSDEQRRYGDWLDHDQRYARVDEFLTIMRQAWDGKPFDFTGEHYTVKGAMAARPPVRRPELYLGGSSTPAHRVAIRHVDVYLTWGESPPRTADVIGKMRAVADELERPAPRAGTRFHVITRDTAAEAWAEADRMLEGMDPALIAKTQERFRRSESEGQRRTAALHGGAMDNLQVYPNVWAGYGLVRPGAGAALVGSHEQVAERIEEFHGLGIDHLILSGQPHVEEAYWFGEGVMPLLRQRGLIEAQPPTAAA
jgi:alkanesulfonate monooxygenase